MVKGGRPEHVAPPEVFYNEDEAEKYTSNTRMIAIQATLTERALELLALPEDGTPKLLLDLGCGSGLSGEALTEQGHTWLGIDIAPAMLDVAVDREVEGDLVLGDLGHGLPLRAGTFDGAISISAVQWLCNADTAAADPRRRMRRFFETLYASLVRGARAVLQIYPESAAQAELLVGAAMRAGFSGGLVVDYPNSTRARKYFLVLMVGQGATVPTPKGLDGSEPQENLEDSSVDVAGRQRSGKRQKTATQGKGRDWVVRKKEQMRKKGYTNIPTDSKYTGRKRRHAV